jgi:AcrR family transcriptional regulator
MAADARLGLDGGERPRAYDMSKRSAGVAGTRRRIAEAALDLFRERDYDDITLAAIADEAGVSHQTVLNHFESKAGVVPAALAVYSEQVHELQFDTTPGDVYSVVRTTVARYEVLGDMNTRWASMEPRMPELISEGRAQAQARFQSWLTAMLSDLMPGEAEPDERRRVLLGLHAALDVFTWKLFRRDLGLSQEEAAVQMTDLVLGILARHRS